MATWIRAGTYVVNIDRVAALLVLIVVAVAQANPTTAPATVDLVDQLTKTDGTIYIGTILDLGADSVKMLVKKGMGSALVTLPRSIVLRIDRVPSPTTQPDSSLTQSISPQEAAQRQQDYVDQRKQRVEQAKQDAADRVAARAKAISDWNDTNGPALDQLNAQLSIVNTQGRGVEQSLNALRARRQAEVDQIEKDYQTDEYNAAANNSAVELEIVKNRRVHRLDMVGIKYDTDITTLETQTQEIYSQYQSLVQQRNSLLATRPR